eukprot:5424641-Lingulodinium_polyedra.AAC.1
MASIPARPRIFHPGSNRGKVRAQIVVGPVDRFWPIPHAEKTCLGDAVRPVGRRSKESSDITVDVDEQEATVSIVDAAP